MELKNWMGKTLCLGFVGFLFLRNFTNYKEDRHGVVLFQFLHFKLAIYFEKNHELVKPKKNDFVGHLGAAEITWLIMNFKVDIANLLANRCLFTHHQSFPFSLYTCWLQYVTLFQLHFCSPPTSEGNFSPHQPAANCGLELGRCVVYK